MREDPNRPDGVIDEALREMIAGTPRDGLPVRVLARIADVGEPAPAHGPGVSFWLGHPIRLAVAATLALVGLAAVLATPRVFQPRPAQPLETASAAAPAGNAAPAIAAAAPPVPAPAVTASAGAAIRFERRLVPASASVETLRNATVEEPDPSTLVRIVPLPDPIPIADRPIEIAPLVIQPVVNREIQIPLIETDRPQKGPGQTDKR